MNCSIRTPHQAREKPLCDRRLYLFIFFNSFEPPSAGQQLNLFQRSWRIVHPRHHGTNIEHITRMAIQLLQEHFVMLHHVPLERVMDMAIEMVPAMEVVLEARDRIVAQNHILTAIFDFQILCDTRELVAERLLLMSVMVAKDEHLLPVQGLENGNGTILVAPEHIAKDKHPVARLDSLVPPGHQCFVHFLNGFEWTVVIGQDVLMAVVPV